MPASAFRTAILAGALALAGTIAPALAEVLTLKTDLKPVPGAASDGTGSVTAHYDTDSKKLTWSGTYKGTATYATSASLYGSAPGPRGGSVRIRDIDSPFEGTAILSQPQGEGLAAGEWAIVIRTAGFPKGELIGRLSRGN